MTVAHEAGKIFLKCDSCDTTRRDTHEQAAFLSMLDTARADGWRVEKQAGCWRHTCGHCQIRPNGRLL